VFAVETASGASTLVTLVVHSVGAVVISRLSTSGKNHVVDDVNDTIAGFDIHIDDLWQANIFVVSTPDLIDAIVHALGACEISVDHSNRLGANKIFRKDLLADGVVFQDVGEKCKVTLDVLGEG